MVPFHRGAVVAPDVDDQRVVQLAHLLDGVEQAADVPVGVLGEAREHLHLARVELLLGVAQGVPGRVGLRPRRELRVRRHDAEALLALEGPLAVGVPAVVELALVLVRPLLGDVVRRVRGARRVVDEPRLVGVVGADRVDPLDRLVGDVVREVVELPVLALRHADDRVVLDDDRVVLAGRAGQEAPPVVEAPGLRPVVERARGAHRATGRQVPLAEAAGDVAVLLEDPGQRPCRSAAAARCSPGTGPGTRRCRPCPRGGGCAR